MTLHPIAQTDAAHGSAVKERAGGCSQSLLFTIAFQAPEFYRELGYREFGRTDADPPAYARVFMKKDLGATRER